ncbi:metal-dependent phosphohydrolase [Desulfolithobacter dissulfuricans]|uniref:Metal-dependent phosphohydrolase n=1 Tax=Desulfolithobacter dissulfuricans TaxID=2795293 RepID=A0A915U0P2_9BACT|nr:HD domain-containing protein [Desulfolithobacter dissulfuricans]BCO09316.1 metal-dependent phosphohydrolase [Desulfolithobacter dissulfuricans]
MYQVPLHIVLLGVAVFLVLIAVLVLILGSRQRQTVIKKITLRELSSVWTKNGPCEIHIANLAPLWRDEKALADQEASSLVFSHKRVTEFYDRQINASWFCNAELHKEVCGKILLLLDKEGDCPSVVNAAGDVEGSWDTNTFNLLSQITLLNHTLNVAEETVKLLVQAEAQHIIPDAMIAALGHDLGKLESVRGYLYSLGEHPLAAGRPLAEIPEFKKLGRKEEITRAIKLHHKMPEGLLGKTLKKADQRARQKELEDAIERLGKDQKPEKSEAAPITKKANEESNSVPARAGNDSSAAWQAQADIYGDDAAETKKEAATPELINISAWFDAQAFLEALKPYINKMLGRRFMAFSMPDGHVYVQVKAMEEVARKMAERAGVMEIATMAQGDATMRKVLFTIVHHLRVEHNVIDRGLIKDAYFGGYFMVTTRDGKSFKGYYTPFHAEAFGSIAEMEKDKPDRLKKFQSVTAYAKKR